MSIGQISSLASVSLGSHLSYLELPKFESFDSAVAAGCRLVLSAEKDELCLASSELGENSPLKIDFVGGRLGHRRHFGGGRNQEICRAVGLNRIPNLSIGDATAGLGRDAFIMAVQGASVTAHEKNPVLAAMLGWSLGRATELARQEQDQELTSVLNRLGFLEADSAIDLAPESFDVIYLDPMFPERDKSAKVKKEMQILHRLLSGDSCEDEALFKSCWSAANTRLVIKRPRKASAFAQKKPHHQILGKTIRYDIYVKQALS